MLPTRNSKRLAGKQNADSTAKCAGASSNENAKKSKRNLNRACKQILQRDIVKEKDKVHNETSTDKKVSSKNASKSSARLLENKSNSQKLKNKEPKKVKIALPLNKNIKVDKENNLHENKMPVPIPPKQLGKTKTNSARKITNYFPLKTISDNAICRIPVWTVNKNLLQKQNKKRSRVSDIYNIEKDEDLMNEPSPVKKKKIVKRPQAIKNKLFSKKTISSHTSHKDKFLSVKAAKPAGRFTKCEALTINSGKTEMIKTNLSKPTLHPVENAENPRTVSVFEPIDPVPESADSGLESASSNSMINTEMPFVVKEIVLENSAEIHEKGKGYVENCINDCYSSFVNIDTSYIALRTSVAKCLSKSANDNMTPDKHSTHRQDKNSSSVEDCINDCYSSFMNLDTSLRESVKKNKAKLTRIEQTPEKFPCIQETNSEGVKISNNSHDGQIFLIPKMTSTPENADHPIVQPVKQLSNNCGLKLSEMSAIPCTVSRNIHFDLSEYEISPIKPASVNQEASFFGSPSKENENPKDEICLPVKISDARHLKEKTEMKDRKKNPQVKCCKLSKNAAKRICMKTKDNHKDIETLFEKENTENAVVRKLGHKRKGPISPLKPIQIDSVSNKSSLNADEDKVALPYHRDNKNAEKILQKPTQSKKIVTKCMNNDTDSCDKNSAGEKNSNVCEIFLFESPAKAAKDVFKSKIPSIKEVKKNIFAKETASSPAEDDDLKVLKPVNCYQSPHQIKKHKPRTKAAPHEQKNIKTNKDAEPQPKKPISRTKAAKEEKQKANDLNEKNVINSLNKHFAELESMDLCIE